MKNKLLILFFVLPSLAIGQKDHTSSTPQFPIDQLTARSIPSAKQYSVTNPNEGIALLKTLLNNDRLEFQHDQTIESLTGKHYSFYQYFDEVRIYRGQVKINTDLDGNVSSILENSFPIKPDIEKHWLRNGVPQPRTVPNSTSTVFVTEGIYFFDGNDLVPAIRTELTNDDGDPLEIIKDEAGKVLYARDLYTYFGANIDTTIEAKVFMPDPLSSAGVEYGFPYSDQDDIDVVVLNAERVDVSTMATYDDVSGLFKLESPYAIIAEHDNPVSAPASSTTPEFYFTREENGFEDVNIFYHINTYQLYVQSLGFNNLMNQQVQIDAHGHGGADQSTFSVQGNIPRLTFGDGCVDDGEDADVIIHEYGHALSFGAAPGSNAGGDRPALDEAIGDYLAASYSRSITEHNWNRVFSWDGHNVCWQGRFVSTNKQYPSDISKNLYTDAEIWSGTLMTIWEDIGRENTDKILLQSMYSYSTGITMQHAAELYMDAEAQLFDSLYHEDICARFKQRGFSIDCNPPPAPPTPNTAINLYNTESFTFNNGFATLELNESGATQMALYDLMGREIWVRGIPEGTTSLNIASESLRTGVYFLVVETPDQTAEFKLVRMQ